MPLGAADAHALSAIELSFEFDQVEVEHGSATATVKAVWVEEPCELCMWVEMTGLPQDAKKRLTIDIARRGMADDRIKHFELENGNYQICVETGYPPDAKFAGRLYQQRTARLCITGGRSRACETDCCG